MVESVVKEVYEKFKGETRGKNPPPLDEAGNSVKAQEVIEYVTTKLNYNLYSPTSVGLK